jgi:hypothetical protein
MKYQIDLTELETHRHHFLTTAAGVSFAHAASVCFESQQHPISIDLPDEGYYGKAYKITRCEVTEEMKRTWNDEERTTEEGAYGVAFLVASREMSMKAIEKSRKKTGIDYWLGEQDGFLLQNKARLEVSGLRHGTDPQVKSRFEQKMKQSEKSDYTRLPALIIIVEFNSPRLKTGLRNIV